ncbi:MAG: TfuA-related McrA-glycine thioamidation protein [Methanomassiliicoccales archaeon]|nr:MAG: TfuA-related McrA-glycine thioamidation protein [Methanomassiliicoccales archaeon]
MKTAVFVGMSISHEEAKSILDAIYLPPIRRGDIPRLSDDVRYVGIIDGVFSSESSVGHREIISLLKKGITVVGGGSMGALRAAELADLGMIGVGKIFEMYRDGVIEGDDEVALVFDPETYYPLSEPLVNIRFFLSNAVKQRVIEITQEQMLIDHMKKIFYPRRTYAALFKIAEKELPPDTVKALRDMLRETSFDLKRSDSLKVLYTLKELQDA